MDMKRSKRFLMCVAVVYWALVMLIYGVAQEQFHYTRTSGDVLTAAGIVGEVADGTVVRQRLVAPSEQITGVEMMTATYARANTGSLTLTLTDASGAELVQKTVDMATVTDGSYMSIPFDAPIPCKAGDAIYLTLTSQGAAPGNAITVYFGNAIATGRVDVAKSLEAEDLYTINGAAGPGQLCARLTGLKALTAYRDYWIVVTALFLIAAGYAVYGFRKVEHGHPSGIMSVCLLYEKYQFLLRQLVSRDFKTKYKRSVLGMAWSFLNPLLTMAVQYVVFSTLFNTGTENYAVYLLSGIVFFNYFSESVALGMTSITGNASLIKKVYIPKYIFPMSKALSSLINFGLALIPLFLVMLFTGVRFTPALLLLVFDILCLVAFAMGMILLMSTSMTFFQDTQFLWSVVSMMWMYLTPLFYPETIIPAGFLPVFRMNPMYQYITFARTCIIDGISPEPINYLLCMGWAVVVLGLGIFTFKKQQSKFVLYL